MYKKFKLKWLLGIFVFLLIVILISYFVDNRSSVNRNRTFKSNLVHFDSAKVDAMIIYPRNNGKVVELKKMQEAWKVKTEEHDYNADIPSVVNMLFSLQDLKAVRLAAKGKENWKEFEVDDSSSTRVQLIQGKKIVCDLYLGKFSYQQPENYNPYMQQQGKMTSYVRPAGDNEVYAVDGIIALSFNRKADDFRDRTLVNFDKESLQKLSFTSPEGNYTLMKNNGKWLLDGMLTDSSSMAGYLSEISRLSSYDFLSHPATETSRPDYSLTIENIEKKTIRIEAFKTDTANKYAITSSINPDSYFSGGKSGLFQKIFVEKKKYLNNNTE